ncbi:hypothetical protein [Reinekea marinisedimentorum]|uniref:Uncharacterized protein n=1 Tax=Reinekea marinisedimentorum TaxID=230495 RepID=A0A4R3I9R3_9GAMM|nr:hypothetical protein [Reinekea marinisedimentorum]TCS43010.1 hypothetical protein BCF53_10233 [Reinekea marinisedimentorum]
MTYTKSMIDLIKEIRRRADADTKPNIKMANPELLSELTDIFQKTKDAITLALIKELFQLAGEPWAHALSENTTEHPRKILKTYRGQTQLVDSPLTQEADQPQHKPPVRIYRGQIVNKV